MNSYGADRVLEPKGYIPTAAWKMDNRREISPEEIRISISHVKLEELNFRQLCNECNYNKAQIAGKIFEHVKNRGKLHNPITDSAGICCGTVEEIGNGYGGREKLKTGTRVICATSLTAIPLWLEEIVEIDFNHALLEVRGYIIAFQSTLLVPFPEDLEVPYTLAALDEMGSLRKTWDLVGKAKRVLILGDGLLTMMLYAAAARKALDRGGYLAAVMDQNSNRGLTREEIRRVVDPYVDNIYFTDILQPVKSFEWLREKEPENFDLSINCSNMLGGEVLSVMITKNKGQVFFTSLISNMTVALLFAESVRKEVTMIPVEEYADGFEAFTENLIRENLSALSVVEEIYNSHKLIRQLPDSAQDMALEQNINRVDDFVYSSPKTRNMLSAALNIARYDCNVIIEGETGVGKERVLEVIYKNSERRANPCVRINCATIPENLAESEFFGYEPNSFTGAGSRAKAGYFELAHTGILFLDEIGSLPLNLQSKLLRVLQEKQFYRIGGQKPIDVDVRVICANNVSVKELVKEGKFREDLYYRLSVCEIYVPPLRERQEDIIVLSESFLKNYNRRYGISKRFGPDAMSVLERYVWPGNVRELDNVVHRLAVSVKGELISEADVILAIRNGLGGRGETGKAIDSDLIREGMLKSAMGDIEKEIIAGALKEYGSTRAAARALGISQSQIMRKKKKYNL